MSFTADEIQTLNDILDKKLSAQSRELERDLEQRFNQRIQSLQREFDQRLTSAQQEIIGAVSQKLLAQQNGMQSTLQQALQAQQMSMTHVVSQEIKVRWQEHIQHLQQQLEQEEQSRQEQLLHLLQQLEQQEQLRQRQQQPVVEQPQIGELVDNALAAQLLAFEELLNQRLMIPDLDDTSMQVAEHSSHFDAIEVQTELPWEDLMDIFGKALDERFAALNVSTLAAIKNEEQQLSMRLHALQAQLHDELEYYRQEGQNRQAQTYTGDLTNMHEVFQSIEQLERIIESMQVAMTTNHALLSNRLYHHQLLPLERAHPGAPRQTAITTRSDHAAPSNGVGAPFPLSGERREQ